MPHQPPAAALPRPTEAELTVRLRAAGCVFAEEEARLLAGTGAPADVLAAMVDQRVAGLPLEHVLGWVDFCGLRLAVGPGVFVPRQRSAFLVECAARLTPTGTTVLDLCCGCGALGAALAHEVGHVSLHASDISGTAVGIARRNLAALDAELYVGDLFEPLPAALRGAVGTLLCNTPYVPSSRLATLPPEAREHEPLVSLDGGEDGLELQRRVARQARGWLAPGGHLLFEVGDDQAEASVRLLTDAGLTAWSRSREDIGATVVIGKA